MQAEKIFHEIFRFFKECIVSFIKTRKFGITVKTNK